MLMLVTLWFVSLPFGFAAQWWDARHGLAPHDYLSWIFEPWALLSFEALFALVVVVIVLGLAGWLGDRWWLVGAPVFVALAALFVFLIGCVAAGRDARRAQRAPARRHSRCSSGARACRGTPVHVQDVSGVTNQANAYSSGFGPSANVVLWNTLLDGRFTPGEVRVVVAHELGHVAHRHMLKGIGWSALLVLPIAWLVTVAPGAAAASATRRALPFALLALVVLDFARGAVRERRLAPLRGGGGLVGAEGDARRGVGAQALRRLPADEPAAAEPADVGLPLAGEPPDDRAAHRDGRGVGQAQSTLVLVAGLRQVPDALGRRPLRPRVLHRVEQVAHELVRDVDARDDDSRHVALLDLVVDARERDRELVLREGDVREVRVDAAHGLGVDVDVELALLGLLVHAPTIHAWTGASPSAASCGSSPPRRCSSRSERSASG